MGNYTGQFFIHPRRFGKNPAPEQGKYTDEIKTGGVVGNVMFASIVFKGKGELNQR